MSSCRKGWAAGAECHVAGGDRQWSLAREPQQAVRKCDPLVPSVLPLVLFQFIGNLAQEGNPLTPAATLMKAVLIF